MALKVAFFIALGIIAFTVYFVVRRNPGFASLFSKSLGIDVIPQSKPISLFDVDIEKITKTVEKLSGDSLGGGEGKEIYRKILRNKDLITMINSAKTMDESKKIVSDWISKNYKVIDQEAERKIKKGSKSGSNKIPNAKSVKKELDIIKAKKREREDKRKKLGSPSKETSNVYNEISRSLESQDIENLIRIMKNLKNESIEDILVQYKNSAETSLFSRIVRKSKTGNDVRNFLKTEIINSIKATYDTLKQMISGARRKGISTKNEELKLLSIPAQIKMFEATLEIKDIHKLKNSISTIKDSIKQKEKKFEEAKLVKNSGSNQEKRSDQEKASEKSG